MSGVSTLKQRYREWVDALLEVMYSEYSSPEMVLESAEVVFQRFMPQALQSRRAAEALAAEEGDGQLVPEFIEQMATKVSIIANDYEAKQKRAPKAEDPKTTPTANPKNNRAARKKAAREAAREAEGSAGRGRG